jgi:hypothetical protein
MSATIVMENEPALRRLVGKRSELGFLRRSLDWLKGFADDPPNPPKP